MSAAGDGGGETRTTMRRLQHDLRTPLGQILGYGEMLQEELHDRALTELLPDPAVRRSEPALAHRAERAAP